MHAGFSRHPAGAGAGRGRVGQVHRDKDPATHGRGRLGGGGDVSSDAFHGMAFVVTTLVHFWLNLSTFCHFLWDELGAAPG